MRSLIRFSCLLIIFATVLTGCSSDESSKGSIGDLKTTEFCARYREFDEKVATAEHEEQRDLLVKISKAPDFPESMRADYELIIEGYNKALNDEPTIRDEDKYEAAHNRIARHATRSCELHESSR